MSATADAHREDVATGAGADDTTMSSYDDDFHIASHKQTLKQRMASSR